MSVADLLGASRRRLDSEAVFTGLSGAQMFTVRLKGPIRFAASVAPRVAFMISPKVIRGNSRGLLSELVATA